eukprot:7564-Heterococcus_DN1.PRE.2
MHARCVQWPLIKLQDGLNLKFNNTSDTPIMLRRERSGAYAVCAETLARCTQASFFASHPVDVELRRLAAANSRTHVEATAWRLRYQHSAHTCGVHVQQLTWEQNQVVGCHRLLLYVPVTC